MVDEVNHFQGIIDDELNRKMVALIAIWIVGSIILQQFVKSRRWQFPAAFAWGTLDSSVLLTVLLLANGIASPLVVGYYLLIAGSGLWFRVRFVWYMTALSLVSYAILIYDFYHWRTEAFRKGFENMPPDSYVVYVLAMLALAGAVAYLVDRVRSLSLYCGQKL